MLWCYCKWLIEPTAIPALLDLPAHGFNLRPDGTSLTRLDLLERELLPQSLEPVDELGARRSETKSNYKTTSTTLRVNRETNLMRPLTA